MLLYLLLLTQQYSGDGMRWYAMITGDAPLQLGGTARLLYPPLARLYFYLAHDILGLPASFALAQSMNALFGGAGIACLAYILFSFTRRWSLALGGAAALACSLAYSLHATDMTEPMPGVFLSLLALAFSVAYVTWTTPPRWLVMAAGASVGLGASIYQSNALTVVTVGAILFLCDAGAPRSRRLVNLLLCVAVAGAVALSLYVDAFLVTGSARTLPEAVAQSLKTEAETTQGIYAEISLRRVGVLIFGLGEALFGLRAIGGKSTHFFSQGLTPEVAWTVGLVAWSVATVALIFAPYAIRCAKLSDKGQRTVVAGLIGLLPGLCLLIYWGARYSKLWMMPLATLLIVLVVLTHEGLEQRARFMRTVFWAGLVVPVVFYGLLFNMVAGRITPNLGMQDTLDIAELLSSRDLIISDWGGTPYLIPSRPHSLSLVGVALEAQLNADDVQAQIQKEIEATVQRGGDVYFYLLLDLSEEEWNISLGQRVKLPYALLDDCRKNATPVMQLRLQTTFGRPLYLWKLNVNK